MRTRKSTAVIVFIVLSLCMVMVLLHGTLGFVRPRDGHDIFADSLHAVIWVVFLISARNLYLSLRSAH